MYTIEYLTTNYFYSLHKKKHILVKYRITKPPEFSNDMDLQSYCSTVNTSTGSGISSSATSGFVIPSKMFKIMDKRDWNYSFSTAPDDDETSQQQQQRQNHQQYQQQQQRQHPAAQNHCPWLDIGMFI